MKAQNRVRLYTFLLALAYLPGTVVLSPLWAAVAFMHTTSPWLLRLAQWYARASDSTAEWVADKATDHIASNWHIRIVPAAVTDWLVAKANDAVSEARREQIAKIDAVMTGRIAADDEVKP